MKPTPRCRRGHALTAANVRKQTNRSVHVDGTVRKYKTRVCVACLKYRRDRTAAGKPIKDLRKGRR